MQDPRPNIHVPERLPIPAKDLARFNLTAALRALAYPSDLTLQRAAGHEFEVSRTARAFYGKGDRGGITIPTECLGAPQRRDLTVGSDPGGGYLVDQDLLAGSFVDLLRSKAVMLQLGTVLNGLRGNVEIPRLSAGGTAYWVTEGSPDITESQQTFAQLALTPKTCGALTEISRRLLLQSSRDIEGLVKSDLATVVAHAIDLACIAGSGSAGQPTGILQTSGIGDIAGGANGLAPTWAHIVGLESEVAIDNADQGRLGYVTNSKVRGKLLVTPQVGAVPPFIWSPGEKPLNGYAGLVTNQVPSNLTKGTSSGVCSAIIFGNWSDLVIGLWSGLDLIVDPFTGSASGRLRITALQDMDCGLRHVESFAAMKDALTT